MKESVKRHMELGKTARPQRATVTAASSYDAHHDNAHHYGHFHTHHDLGARAEATTYHPRLAAPHEIHLH